MGESSDPEHLRALLDFADEALCLFSLVDHELVLSNAAATRFVSAAHVPDKGIECTLPYFLGLFLGRLEVQSVVQDIQARLAEKQSYLLDSMSVSREGQNITVSGKLHSYGNREGILLRVNVTKSKHGATQTRLWANARTPDPRSVAAHAIHCPEVLLVHQVVYLREVAWVRLVSAPARMVTATIPLSACGERVK